MPTIFSCSQSEFEYRRLGIAREVFLVPGARCQVILDNRKGGKVLQSYPVDLSLHEISNSLCIAKITYLNHLTYRRGSKARILHKNIPLPQIRPGPGLIGARLGNWLICGKLADLWRPPLMKAGHPLRSALIACESLSSFLKSGDFDKIYETGETVEF